MACAVIAFAALPQVVGGPVGVAHAEPPPPCSYELSAPQVVPTDSGPMVRATVGPDQCGFPGAPAYGLACLKHAGDSSAGTCTQGRGEDAAQVLVPYSPGVTYEASGRGCGKWAGIDGVAPLCQLLGPMTASL
jgi:hypothetical protein